MNVLQDMPATDQGRLIIGVAFGVEISDDCNLLCCAISRLMHIAWIEAKPTTCPRFAQDQGRLIIGVAFGVEISDDCNLLCCAISRLMHIAWIEAKPTTCPRFAQQCQKIPLPTTDLNNFLPVQVITIY